MFSLLQRLRGAFRRFQLRHRFREIADMLEVHYEEKVLLKPWGSITRSGDQLCRLWRTSNPLHPVGVLRWNLLHSLSVHSDEPDLPRSRSVGESRLRLEHDAYRQLAPLGLSPQPLLLSHDFSLNSWVSGERLADVLRADPDAVWLWLPAQLTCLQQIHTAGVLHLDANCGNWLVDVNRDQPYLIDFEYAPGIGWSESELQAFDYVRLLHDLVRPRRAGPALLKNTDKFGELLRTLVPRNAARSMSTLPESCFRRLRESPGIWKQIERLMSCTTGPDCGK